VTVIMVTHGALGTGVVARTVELRDGCLANGTHGREIRPPDTVDDPAELSWVVWREAQSITEWEAIQLTALGVSDATGWHGSMAEAGWHARACAMPPALCDHEFLRRCAGGDRRRNRRPPAFSTARLSRMEE
jgi:hypothetical protein